MVKNNLGEKAKKNLIGFARLCDEHLEKYWSEEIENHFGFNETQKSLVKKMLLHAKEHNLRSAKRARAGFVWYGYKLGCHCESRPVPIETSGSAEAISKLGIATAFSPRDDETAGDVWKVCEGVELVHTALLMHDDFMDRDLVRRGQPTTQVFFGKGDKHYGDTMAVNVGDSVLCLGFERILTSGFELEKIQKVMRQILRGITDTAFGQAYDVSLSKLGELTEEKVVGLHRAKTAIYTYENPLIMGGILAGLPEEVLDVLREYSVDGGIAFQLQDDILGVFGDEEKTGKSANSDLLQGKVTLLVVKTLELGTRDQKADLLKVWGKLKASNEDIERAKKAIKESGACEYSVEVAKKLNWKSVETIQKLRGMGLNSEAIDYLEGIARYMVEREV